MEAQTCIFIGAMAKMRQHNYYLYIVTNASKTVLYTGVTNDIARRLCEHYLNRGNEQTFAGKYYCYNLIYYEHYHYIQHAISRETEIKAWRRSKKLDLIKTLNPNLEFMNKSICEVWPPEIEGV
jgi:putative endonuclease